MNARKRSIRARRKARQNIRARHASRTTEPPAHGPTCPCCGDPLTLPYTPDTAPFLVDFRAEEMEFVSFRVADGSPAKEAIDRLVEVSMAPAESIIGMARANGGAGGAGDPANAYHGRDIVPGIRLAKGEMFVGRAPSGGREDWYWTLECILADGRDRIPFVGRQNIAVHDLVPKSGEFRIESIFDMVSDTSSPSFASPEDKENLAIGMAHLWRQGFKYLPEMIAKVRGEDIGGMTIPFNADMLAPFGFDRCEAKISAGFDPARPGEWLMFVDGEIERAGKTARIDESAHLTLGAVVS